MISFFLALLQPLPLVLLLLGVLLARLWRRCPESRKPLRWPIAAWVLLWFIGTPAAGWLALASVERRERPPDLTELPEADAIVILGSAILPVHPLPGRTELDRQGLTRVRHGAALYERGLAPLVIVSGGQPDPDMRPTLAVRMADELRRLGVPDRAIVLEDQSTTTRENAVESASLLYERGLSSILLVTDAQHMPRAAGCFRERDLDVVPVACRYRTFGHTWRLADLIPSTDGLAAVQEAWQEWVRLGHYRLRGWIR